MSTGPETGTDGRGADGWISSPALTVWAYDSPMGAAAGYVRLRNLQGRGGIFVEDAITAAWVPGAHRPRIGHVRPRTTGLSSPQGRSVLGALVEVLLRPGDQDPVPMMVAVFEGTGVDERILTELRAAIAPGRSVLLILSSGTDPDQARSAFQRGLARGDMTMTYAVLPVDAVATLRVVTGDVRLAPNRLDGPSSS